MSINDFTLSLSRLEWETSSATNTQTLMIGGDQHRYVKSTDTFLKNDSYGRSILEKAKVRLDSLDFVGITSDLMKSFTLLTWWLGIPPLNVTYYAT